MRSSISLLIDGASYASIISITSYIVWRALLTLSTCQSPTIIITDIAIGWTSFAISSILIKSDRTRSLTCICLNCIIKSNYSQICIWTNVATINSSITSVAICGANCAYPWNPSFSAWAINTCRIGRTSFEITICYITRTAPAFSSGWSTCFTVWRTINARFHTANIFLKKEIWAAIIANSLAGILNQLSAITRCTSSRTGTNLTFR